MARAGLHTGGIFAALSASTAEVAAEAMDAARQHGTPVSYDLNYRDSLWKSIGGKTKAQEVNRELVRKVDLLLGNEEDFSAMLGVEIKGVGEDFAELPIAGYEEMLREVAAAYPNLKLIASTLRTAHTASRNAWGAIALYQDRDRPCASARDRHLRSRGWRRQLRIRPHLRNARGQAD